MRLSVSVTHKSLNRIPTAPPNLIEASVLRVLRYPAWSMPGGGTPEATCVAHADKENAGAAWQDTGMEAVSTVSLEDRSGGAFLYVVSPFFLFFLHVVFHRFLLLFQS